MAPLTGARGTLPANEHSAPAPSRLGSGSARSQRPLWLPEDPHRTQGPQGELCLLNLETVTRAKRLGIGSPLTQALILPKGSGGHFPPHTKMDIWPGQGWEMKLAPQPL